MHELGYVEGQHLLTEFRSAEGHIDRLPGLAAELVNVPVELLVVTGDAQAVAAARATTVIPIVTAGGNPVGRVVNDVAHPEGNVTGVSVGGPAVVGKWIQLLAQIVPTMNHLAAVSDFSGTPASRDAAGLAAEVLKVSFRLYDLRDLDQLSALLATVVTDGADGLVMLSGGVVGGGSDPRIGSAVLQSRLPSVGQNRDFAVNGALLAHGPNTATLARRSAAYVDKILKGAKPGDLPIELPTAYDIVVNLRTATTLGITVPEAVLQQATEIIQ